MDFTRRLVPALLLGILPALPAAADPPRVHSLRIVILSTMLSDEGIGEWGFGALVEADGERILFDTGARPSTVLDNARALKVDLAGVREVVLSHNHSDHTGGLMTLRRELSAARPDSLSRAHVGRGIDRGLVILAACGHAGIVNTVKMARRVVREAPVYAVVGGLHLFPLDDEHLDWTADRLHGFGLGNLLGAHCTGIEGSTASVRAGGCRGRLRWWVRWARASSWTRASTPATWRASRVMKSERVLTFPVKWVMKNTNPAAALAWLVASERFSSPC